MVNNIGNNPLNNLLNPNPVGQDQEVDNPNNLSQEDFLSLLTQQLAYQDPFKPVENSEMVSQMSAFSTNEGIADLNSQVSSITQSITSSQALSASSLIGKEILAPTQIGHFNGVDEVSASVVFSENPSSIEVVVENEQGAVVKSFNVDASSAKRYDFAWDGTNNQNKTVESGNYKIKVFAKNAGKTIEATPAVYAKVQSISVDSTNSSMALNLQGLGSISMQDVIEIKS